ncbi:MAG: LOG family protein, partial [Nocardioidaceae bacterium]
RDEALLRLDPAGSLFLGCVISPPTGVRLRERGALIFPALPDVPFDAYRSHLYTPEELYAGLEDGYDHTLDARIYAWSRGVSGSTSIRDTLGQALHDNAIDDALVEFVRTRRVVGVMGGHALGRNETAYADAARLAHRLAGLGLTVATGGGPGAMEAANLGARLGDEPVAALERALAKAATVPTFRPSVTAWARAAFEAVDGLGGSGRSLGIPTWFYGHEPPNPFCVRVAKYFKNAIREDVLLHVCRSGIVFLPGAAGTVQEVFQSACENYYAEPGAIAPMVLYDTAYWTSQLPAWPLLETMARDRAMAGSLHLVDDLDDVVALLTR